MADKLKCFHCPGANKCIASTPEYLEKQITDMLLISDRVTALESNPPPVVPPPPPPETTTYTCVNCNGESTTTPVCSECSAPDVGEVTDITSFILVGMTAVPFVNNPVKFLEVTIAYKTTGVVRLKYGMSSTGSTPYTIIQNPQPQLDHTDGDHTGIILTRISDCKYIRFLWDDASGTPMMSDVFLLPSAS